MINISKIAFGFLILFLFACDKDQPDFPIPDVNHIDIPSFSWQRFDQDVMAMDAENIINSYKELSIKYPSLTDLYFKRLLSISQKDSPSFYNNVAAFIKAEPIQKIQDTIEHVFKNTDNIESEIKKACQYLKYYFPNTGIPNFYTMQTEFGYQQIIFPDGDQDGICIGLDLFLGEDFDYKLVDPTNTSFSNYLTRTFNKDHIAKKVIELKVLDLIGDPPGKRFIDQIIHSGKKLFILERLLPMTHDSVILEYSKEQVEWIYENEREIWSFFLDKNLIYETNHLLINKYISPRADSPGMPEIAPGRTGNFIGLQIVKAYVRRYPETTLTELIDMFDAQKLMELSKYKPKRR
ncbi:MAG: hypothetical protein HKN51_01895 [Saprospiraceae bacterium]|nr:hypothetical protein [Saprospiraceae bacterium]